MLLYIREEYSFEKDSNHSEVSLLVPPANILFLSLSNDQINTIRVNEIISSRDECEQA